METVSRKLNTTQLTDIALQAKDIHTAELQNEMVVENPISRAMVVDSTNNPADVEQADSTNNSPEPVMMQKSGDQYFPIQLTLPSNNPVPATTNNGTTPMTEEEKRKRAIMIASIILMLLIILVAIASRKKAGK